MSLAPKIAENKMGLFVKFFTRNVFMIIFKLDTRKINNLDLLKMVSHFKNFEENKIQPMFGIKLKGFGSSN
jgi:hypothetical protein